MNNIVSTFKNIISLLTLNDLFFFISTLILILLLIYIVYLVREEKEEEMSQKDMVKLARTINKQFISNEQTRNKGGFNEI